MKLTAQQMKDAGVDENIINSFNYLFGESVDLDYSIADKWYATLDWLAIALKLFSRSELESFGRTYTDELAIMENNRFKVDGWKETFQLAIAREFVRVYLRR